MGLFGVLWVHNGLTQKLCLKKDYIYSISYNNTQCSAPSLKHIIMRYDEFWRVMLHSADEQHTNGFSLYIAVEGEVVRVNGVCIQRALSCDSVLSDTEPTEEDQKIGQLEFGLQYNRLGFL